jgi:hypothetical protein
MMFLSTAVAGSLLAFLPTTASAQSWGSYGQGYRSYGYNDGYYRDGRRDHWRERRERWERHERWEARRRWEREREWRREHRERRHHWRDDDDRY